MATLLQARKHTIILKSKADDVKFPYARHVRTIAEIKADTRNTAFVLDPKYERQAYEFASAYDLAWKEKGWTIYIDELYYHTDLGLEKWINRLLTQGRSLGITVVTAMQRPAKVTRFALSQATHILTFSQEGRDIQTLVEATTPRLKEPVSQLDRHQFLWYYRPERKFWTGYVQDLARGSA